MIGVMKLDRTGRAAVRRQAEVFKALGHPARMAMVHALANGPVCACELAEAAGCGHSTASRHLAVLRGARIVADERRGQQMYYQLLVPCVLSFAECLDRSEKKGGAGRWRVSCCS